MSDPLKNNSKRKISRMRHSTYYMLFKYIVIPNQGMHFSTPHIKNGFYSVFLKVLTVEVNVDLLFLGAAQAAPNITAMTRISFMLTFSLKNSGGQWRTLRGYTSSIKPIF